MHLVHRPRSHKVTNSFQSKWLFRHICGIGQPGSMPPPNFGFVCQTVQPWERSQTHRQMGPEFHTLGYVMGDPVGQHNVILGSTINHLGGGCGPNWKKKIVRSTYKKKFWSQGWPKKNKIDQRKSEFNQEVHQEKNWNQRLSDKKKLIRRHSEKKKLIPEAGQENINKKNWSSKNLHHSPPDD